MSTKNKCIIASVCAVILIVGYIVCVSIFSPPLIEMTRRNWWLLVFAVAILLAVIFRKKPPKTKPATRERLISPKNKYIVTAICAAVFIVGYIVCKLFLSGEIIFGHYSVYVYTVDWITREFIYIFVIGVIAIVLALCGRKFAAIGITAGCFVGMPLGEVIGNAIIAERYREIDRYIANGWEVDVQMENMAYIHYGVFIWFETILIAAAIGVIVDLVIKKRIQRALDEQEG